MKYLDSFEQVTNRPYNATLIGQSKSIRLGYRRGRRYLCWLSLLALAVIGFYFGGGWYL